MLFKKLLLLLVLLCPLQDLCDKPKVQIRQCSTLRLHSNSFFNALDASHNQTDEQQILTELCNHSSKPWHIMQSAAQRANQYPRQIESGVFTDSSEFAQAVAGCITDEGINTQALESRFQVPTIAKFLWCAASAFVGFSSAIGYMKYMKN